MIYILFATVVCVIALAILSIGIAANMVRRIVITEKAIAIQRTTLNQILSALGTFNKITAHNNERFINHEKAITDLAKLIDAVQSIQQQIISERESIIQ